jgi:hypothetical protein
MTYYTRNERYKMLVLRMNYNAFKSLMLQFISFLQSQCFNLMKSWLDNKKIVTIVIYKFAHRHNVIHMIGWFNVSALII